VKPLEVMAPWERVVAHVTPAFYAVRMMRAAMLGVTPVLVTDILTLLALGSACFALGYVLFVWSGIQRR
jgi:hypothetical protein